MKINFDNDNDFTIFKDELKERLTNRIARKIDPSGFVKSAVMILLMNINNSPGVLLTKRSEKVKTHKGQISLPGGACDDEDGDILHTAYRETFEEVGIPCEKIELIGQFDDYISITNFHLASFVGAVEFPAEYSFSDDEIDDYVEAPISIFINGEYDRIEKFHHLGRDFKVYYYLYNNFDIWGLTARVLTDFALKVCKE